MNYPDSIFLSRHSYFEKRFARLILRALSDQYNEMADLFASGQDIGKVDDNGLKMVYQAMYQLIMEDEGTLTWNSMVAPITNQQISKKDIFDEVASTLKPQEISEMTSFWRRLMDGFLQTYIVFRINEVLTTGIKRVTDLIFRQRGQGLSNEQITALIRSIDLELRANTIARTETTNAMSKAQIFALESSGLNWQKAWKAIRDDRTRDSHIITDPKLFIPLKDNFIIQGQQLAYPGDSTQGATPNNTINCRCRLAFKQTGARFGFNINR
jgi:hypothetical protein